MEKVNVEIPVMADLFARGEKPEYLLWIGCAGAFDDRYKKVVREFAKILTYLKVDFAVLGKEETCTGDPARRAGNEMLFQMQAFTVLETFKMYEVTRVITVCPHCYNTFKNEYPDLGATFTVINYLQFIEEQINKGKLVIENKLKEAITYHDPCYLGRANGIYEVPRHILSKLTDKSVEMPRNKSFALCCGAGGAQMFKEAEKGVTEVFIERTKEALATGTDVIATACPFCMTMMTDGIKYANKEESVKNLDIAELISLSLNL